MPQAMLIDINTAAITHRNGVLSGITDRNYSKVLRHLYCFNAALPAQYQVHIDSDEYNEKIKANMIAQCGFCTTPQKQNGSDLEVEMPTETEHTKIKMVELLLPSQEQFLSGHKYESVWTCPKCHHDNKQSETVFIQSVIKQPYYLRCVKEPPLRKTGITDRMTFHVQFESWASTFLEELEQAAAKFRQEYKPKDQSEIGENMIDFGDESD